MTYKLTRDIALDRARWNLQTINKNVLQSAFWRRKFVRWREEDVRFYFSYVVQDLDAITYLKFKR